MNVSAEIIVQGIVQGVGYRWFTERKANELHLTGWVKNLDHGDVSVTVEGDRRMIELFIEKLKTGPSMAKVTQVQVQWLPYTGQLPAFYITP
jgi:acylphosphatase